MPEQAEWVASITQSDNPNAHSDSGDYRWHPEYARRAVAALGAPYPVSKPVVPPYSGERYDTRTLGEQVDELKRQVRHLEGVVHKYINSGDDRTGE
jgi:hypothetical protein